MEYGTMIYLIITFIISMIVNPASLVILIKKRHLLRRKWFVLANLLVAHTIQTVVSLPLLMVSIANGRWAFNITLCQIDSFIMAACGFETIFTHFVMSIERYSSVQRTVVITKKLLFWTCRSNNSRR